MASFLDAWRLFREVSFEKPSDLLHGVVGLLHDACVNLKLVPHPLEDAERDVYQGRESSCNIEN